MAPPKSWLSIPEDSDFSLANIPFGIIRSKFSDGHRPAIPIGNHVLDLKAFSSAGGFAELTSFPKEHLSVFDSTTLNDFAALGQKTHENVRKYIQDVFSESTSHPEILKDNSELQKAALLPKHETKNLLPMKIGDYTDFYAGYNHAFNAGCLFRDPENALKPNYTHLPVGYHGRASSVVVSGTPIHRPQGQILPPGSQTPIHGPSKKLDIELELGCLLCTSNPMGTSLKLNGDAEEAIFGYVLMNDWSSRDIQRWEYVPLGPFNGKNFGTTISPWVVLPGALEPYRVKKLENKTELLPYLQEKRQDTVYDISLSIDLTIGGDEDPATTTIAKVSSSNLLWSFPQMIAHHTMGGCPMNVGDLLGSGTISGTSKNELGSLLEMGKDGKEGEELMLAGMNTRKWLLDGDVATFRGKAGEGVGFGECTGRVVGTSKH